MKSRDAGAMRLEVPKLLQADLSHAGNAVRGAPPHIYLERLTLDSLDRLGLRVDQSNRPADVYIQIPVNRKAIFRASVMHEGIPVSDVLQVWLDVSTHPARGREQAREIWRRVLKPLFGKQ